MEWSKLRHKLAKAEQGQSLVEFALSMVIIIIILSGLLDLGRVYYIYVALEDSAGEAALFLSLNPDCETATDCADPNNAAYRAEYATSGVLDWTKANAIITGPNFDGVGATVRVQIDYTYELFTPFIRQFGGSIPLSVNASQTVLSE